MSTQTQYTAGPLKEQPDGSFRDDFGSYYRHPGRTIYTTAFNAPTLANGSGDDEQRSVRTQERAGPQFV